MVFFIQNSKNNFNKTIFCKKNFKKIKLSKIYNPKPNKITHKPTHKQATKKHTNKMADSRKKLVVVGDGTCGKTCLLISYVKREFNEKYVPTIFETYITDIKVSE